MKNLFKHFNDIDIDVNEFEEADVTEFEKAQFKRDLKRQVSKTKNRKWLKGVAAVCLSLGIGTASLIGLSYTTFAHEIPIVNSIIKLFSTKDKIISGYEEFADQQHLVAESNGTTITVNESLFDSKKFLVGYYIETDRDLGEHPEIETTFKVDGREHALFHTEHIIEKVGPNKYAGLTTAILNLSNQLEQANFEFHISSLSNRDTKEMVQGSWDFEIDVKATENKVQFVEAPASKKADLGIKINEIIYTPISFIVNYTETQKNEMLKEKWDVISSDLNVKDDLGNTYTSRLTGGTGNGQGFMEYVFTYEKLHPDANTLIFTPIFKLMEAEIDENGVKWVNPDSDLKMEIIELSDIIIKIPK